MTRTICSRQVRLCSPKPILLCGRCAAHNTQHQRARAIPEAPKSDKDSLAGSALLIKGQRNRLLRWKTTCPSIPAAVTDRGKMGCACVRTSHHWLTVIKAQFDRPLPSLWTWAIRVLHDCIKGLRAKLSEDLGCK